MPQKNIVVSVVIGIIIFVLSTITNSVKRTKYGLLIRHLLQ